MKLCIHRGTHQIGGIAAEISTASTCILIDMGDELSLDPNFVSAPLNIPGVTDGNGHCAAVRIPHCKRGYDNSPWQHAEQCRGSLPYCLPTITAIIPGKCCASARRFPFMPVRWQRISCACPQSVAGKRTKRFAGASKPFKPFLPASRF